MTASQPFDLSCRAKRNALGFARPIDLIQLIISTRESILRWIRYVSTCPGSGKTYAICIRAIRKVRRGKKILIVQPTIDLIEQTLNTIRSLHPNIEIIVFHGEIIEYGVCRALERYLEKPSPNGHIVITTWKAFISIEKFPSKENWEVCIDEVPESGTESDLKVPRSHSVISKHLSVSPFNDKYSIVSILNPAGLKEIYANRMNDAVWNVFRGPIFFLLSPHYENFVITKSFINLINNKGRDRRLTFFSSLRPSLLDGFESVLIAGARYSETLLCKIWTVSGVRFREDRSLLKLLKFQSHTNGARITFYYATEARWSKEKSQSTDNTIVEQMISSSQTLFGGDSFLYLTNKNCKKTSYLEQKESAQSLPAYSHGRNDFQDFTNVLVTAAYNYTSGMSSFLQEICSISYPEQRIALGCHHIYQAINRCSIRNELSTLPVTIIIPDRFTAEWCASVFPGSSFHFLGISSSILNKKVGRKEKYSSRSEKNKAYYQKLKKRRACKQIEK